MKSFNLTLLIVTMIISTLAFQSVHARQFRRMAPIPVQPSHEVFDPSGGMSVLSPSGSKATLQTAEELVPLDDQLIASEIQKIVQSWNKAGLDSYLDENFPQRFQLLSMLQRDTPRDASLQLLSIQNISTLNQAWSLTTGYSKRSRTSTVVATVNLQLRFIDPFKGVVTLPHTSQFYLRVVEVEGGSQSR